MQNLQHYLRLPLTLLVCSLFTTGAIANDFPGRAKHPSVGVISMEDLHKKRNDVIIVDTRSQYEYDTLHIKQAINIPISSLDFTSKIRKLYKQHNKTIVFYCNGHNCMKSYNAVIKAKRFAKVDDTLAYDGGILDWSHRYPKDSVLLKQSPIDTSLLISEADFKKRLIKPKQFLEKANNNCIVIDVRDSSQRTDRLFAGYEHAVDMDNTEKLDKLIGQSITTKQPICAYDAVGQQVQWLQYYLRKKKLQNYFFLEGGAKAFLDTPYKELYR